MWKLHIVEMWRCGGSTLSRCGDVVDPHFKCGGPHIIRIYQRMNVNLHYSDLQYICIYSHLKCGNPHCSTIHPHCSTLHPHSKCGDVVDPHCIHIVHVKVHIVSTSQATWTHSSILYTPKMTKLSSKLNLTKLFYISPQQNLDSPLK